MRYFILALFLPLIIVDESFSAGWKDNVGKRIFAPYISVGIPANPKEFRIYNVSTGYGIIGGRIGKSSIVFRPSVSFSSFALEASDTGYFIEDMEILSIGMALIYKPVRDKNIAPYCGMEICYIRKEIEKLFFSETSNHPGLDWILGIDFIIQNMAVIFVENSYKTIFDGDNTGYFSVNLGLGVMF